jgi:L-aminopeptidase/D-esterase-like protein
VRDAVLQWYDSIPKVDISWHQPVVGETSDAGLNDMQGFHVKREHVFAAMNGAKGGPVPEGNVGGGTGMRALGFKAGTGTASRKVGNYTVGVLVQANFGSREQLTVAGVPVGKEVTDVQPSQAFHIRTNETKSLRVFVAVVDNHTSCE